MISPMSAAGSAITMSVLADKAERGMRLTNVEQNLVMVNALRIFSGSFGPIPEDMPLTPMLLPENVKGILASFSL